MASSTAWLEVWIPLVCFAHALAAVLLARNIRALRHAWPFALIRRAWRRCTQCRTSSKNAASDHHMPVRSGSGSAPGLLVTDTAKAPLALALLPGATYKAAQSSGSSRAVLAWRGLGCSYPVRGQGGPSKKAVLKDAMGVVCEGQIAGILGPSGGGKSTLLEMLAGRKALGEFSGRIGLAGTRAPASITHTDNTSALATPEQTPRPESWSQGLGDATLEADRAPEGVGVSTGSGSGEGGSSADCSPTAPIGTDTPTIEESSVDSRWLVWRGVKQHGKAAGNMCAFVPQECVFPASLTASEVLSMYASLVDSHNIDTQGLSRKERVRVCVESALRDVRLADQANTLVGGPLPGGLTLRGLSGGEKKRLSVATGLIRQPTLLLLDEPTTGLDSFAAAGLISLLSHLCTHTHSHRLTVVCSLHQPRAAIWEALDVVVVLSQGLTVYSGPRPGLVQGMGRLGYMYTPSLHGSPANWVLDLVNTSFGENREGEDEGISGVRECMRDREELVRCAAATRAHWAASHPHLEAEVSLAGVNRTHGVKHVLQQLLCGGATCVCVSSGPITVDHTVKQALSHTTSDGHTSVNDGHTTSPAQPLTQSHTVTQRRPTMDVGGASWWRQVAVLTWREAKLVINNPMDLAGRLLMFCWAAVVIGLVFYGLKENVTGIVSRSVVVYVEAIVLFLLPFVYMSYYTADRQIFTSELVARIYRPSAYYLSKVTQLTLVSSVNAALFAGIVYGMAGLEPKNHSVLENMILATLGYLVAQQVLFCASILAPNQDLAFMISILWTAINILLANYPIRVADYTMDWIAPVRYVSALYFTFSGLLATQFTDAPPLNCSTGVGNATIAALPQYLPLTFPSQIRIVQGILASPGKDCRLDLTAVVDYYGVQWSWWGYALLLLGYLFLMHVLSYLALMWATRREKR